MFVLRSSDGDVALAGAGAAHALVACCVSSFGGGLVEAECLLSGFFSGAIFTLAVIAAAYVPGVSSDCLGNEGGGVAGGSANGCDETITLLVVS